MNLLKKGAALAAGALLMLPWIGALPAFAEQPNSVEDELNDGTFTYELVDGSYTITHCRTDAMMTELPELVNGYAVTAIGDQAFIGCTYISDLKIPESIKRIGDSAFAGCTSLETITLPSKLTTLSASTFFGCTALKELDIPDGVTYIGDYCFYNCNSLTSLELPSSLDTIQEMAFAECAAIDSFDASKCSKFTFSDGILYTTGKTEIIRASTKLSGDVYIGDTVTSIRPGAFSLCYDVEHVFLPSSVTYIGEDAFGYCKGLKSVDFSYGLNTIDDIAFKFCTALESVDLPSSLSTIGDGAFYNCQALSKAVIPESVSSIGTGAFLSCPNLKQVSVPGSVNSIGDSAFGFSENGSTGEYQPVPGFAMSVFDGSAGHKYARSSDIEFTVVDRSLKKVAFIIIAVGAIIAAAIFAVVLMIRGRKSASAAVKKADKEAKEASEDENYKGILDE